MDLPYKNYIDLLFRIFGYRNYVRLTLLEIIKITGKGGVFVSNEKTRQVLLNNIGSITKTSLLDAISKLNQYNMLVKVKKGKYRINSNLFPNVLDDGIRVIIDIKDDNIKIKTIS